MRLRLLLVGFGVALVGAAVVAIAQPPMLPTSPSPLPPITQPSPPPAIAVPPVLPGTLPPASPSPARANECPLSRFEPLGACPIHTQNAVRGALLSANWMIRMNQSHGRFIYGFNPALRQPLLRDHDLFQARAAMAMALLAKFIGDEKQAAIASQAILTLLTTTKVDPTDPN
ncbi:MAG TPA: hypothetical protein VG122_08320, partial [Gemmata sp.]|nr:hypothetical protein [Gemmata sp.]